MLQVSLFRDLSPDGNPLPQSARTWATYSRKLDPIDSQSMKTMMTIQKSLKKILMTNLQQNPNLQRRLQPMKEQIETTAETVEEAIEIALRELDVERHQIEVNVVDKGKTGVLGIGSEEAKVIVRVVDSPSNEILEASLILESLIDIMGVEVTHSLHEGSDPDSDAPTYNIEGEDSGLLIGRRGETLRALQLIVRLLVSRKIDQRTNLNLDVGGYQERRYRSVTGLAKRVASKVASTGRSMSLEPMPPNERRAVHMVLSDHPDVITESEGFGSERQVVIHSK